MKSRRGWRSRLSPRSPTLRRRAGMWGATCWSGSKVSSWSLREVVVFFFTAACGHVCRKASILLKFPEECMKQRKTHTVRKRLFLFFFQSTALCLPCRWQVGCANIVSVIKSADGRESRWLASKGLAPVRIACFIASQCSISPRLAWTNCLCLQPCRDNDFLFIEAPLLLWVLHDTSTPQSCAVSTPSFILASGVSFFATEKPLEEFELGMHRLQLFGQSPVF